MAGESVIGRGGGFRVAFPGGGGVAIGGVGTAQFVSLPTPPVAADGITHSLFPAFNPPPADWVDFSGGRSHIVKPGVYGYTWLIDRVAAFADPTLLFQFYGFNVTDLFVADPGKNNTFPTAPHHFTTTNSATDIVSVDSADLPFTISAGIAMPTDATGTLQVALVLQRLAWKP